MTKLTPKYVICPVCGKRFTNRGYQNHVNKCKGMSPPEKKAIIRIRHMPK